MKISKKERRKIKERKRIRRIINIVRERDEEAKELKRRRGGRGKPRKELEKKGEPPTIFLIPKKC